MSYKNLQYVAVFTLIFLSVFWQYTGQGMFMDGIIYATISRNLAINIGSFFEPIYVDPFESNLSLTYFIQSLFFRIFGDFFWVEKLHNALFLIFNAILIHRIFKIHHKSTALPILFWWFTPTIPWIFTNNMMEITVSFFFLLSLFFYLKYYKSHEKKYLILYILATLLASYSKAFVGFFPLVFPFIHHVTYRNKTTINFLKEYVLILTWLGLFFLAVFTYETAWIQWKRIIAYQLHSNDLVTTSFWMSKLHFINEIIAGFWPQALIILMLLIIKKQKKYSFSIQKETQFFGILFLCSILPFSIFKKFFGFYLAISAPFLALGLASFMLQFKPLIENQFSIPINKKALFIFLLVLNLIGFCIAFYHFGAINRDKNWIEDTQFIASKINPNANSYLNLSPDYGYDFYAQAYLARTIPIEIRMYTADTTSNFKGYYISKNSLSPNAIKSPQGLYYLNSHP
jgi:hypothetical protein